MNTQPDTRNMDEYDPLLAAYNDGDGNQTQQPAHSPLPLDSISCGNYSNAMVEDLAKTHAETLEQLQMAQDALKARDAFAKRLEKRVRHASKLAEALRDMVKTHSNLDNLEPRHWKQAEQALHAYEAAP